MTLASKVVQSLIVVADELDDACLHFIVTPVALGVWNFKSLIVSESFVVFPVQLGAPLKVPVTKVRRHSPPEIFPIVDSPPD